MKIGNIPKPNKHLFDINLPIYKKDDPNQAGKRFAFCVLALLFQFYSGEMGKAVKIDKEVSVKNDPRPNI